MNRTKKFIKTTVIFTSVLPLGEIKAHDSQNEKEMKLVCNSCYHHDRVLDSTDQELFSIQGRHHNIKKALDATKNPRCLLRVAQIFYYGDYDTPKNYKKAHFFFEHQTHCSGTEGNYFLGQIYQNGYGVEKNNQKALEYFKKAAESESDFTVEANYQLSVLHYKSMISTPETAYLLRGPAETYALKALGKVEHTESFYQMGLLYLYDSQNAESAYYKNCYLSTAYATFEVAAIGSEHPASYYQLGKISITGYDYQRYNNAKDSLKKRLKYLEYRRSSVGDMTTFNLFKKAADLGHQEAALEVINIDLNRIDKPKKGEKKLTDDEIKEYFFMGNLSKLALFKSASHAFHIPLDIQKLIVSTLITLSTTATPKESSKV